MISPMLLQGILPKGSPGNLFQNNNQGKSLVGGQKRFSGILSQMMGAPKNGAAKGLLGKQAFGHAFLEQLKKKLMATGMPLDHFVANEQALNSFAKLLMGAG